MASTNPYSDNYSSERSSRSGLGIITDMIMLILTLVFCIGLTCAYFARYVNPNTIWFFAFAGLAAPALYILNIVCALYWAIRWRVYFFIPFVILLLGIGNISLFFKPTLSKNYTEKNPRMITVMSYNVMGFIDETDSGRKFSTLDTMTSFINSLKPDILCLQEFQSMTSAQKEDIDQRLDLPYNVYNYTVPNRSGGGWGLAIYSNYRIVNSGQTDFENSTNSSLWADIIVMGDTVRVFNNHLQTTSVNNSEREYIMNQEFLHNTPDREEKVKGIISKLKRNFCIRASQADSIAPSIHNSPYAVLVCGDFNDTPMSYSYNTIRGKLADSFVEKGRGMSSNTFNGLFNMFRIDYILHSKDIKAINYSTPDNDFSDHKAVVAGFSMPSKN